MKKEVLAAALLLVFENIYAQDWPQWRGSNRDGHVRDIKLLDTWPDSLRLRWSVSVGSGRSSPVVADGKIFVHTRQNDDEVISCLSLSDGQKLWSQTHVALYLANRYATEQGKGPFSTPTYHDGRIYTLGVNGLLTCFDAVTGKQIWQREFAKQVNTSQLFSGTSMSPLVEGGLCMVHVGDDRNGALIAYDALSGEEKWRWTEQGPGYASPIAVEIAGVRQLVTLTDEAAIGMEIASGKLLWQIPFIDEWNENIVTPVVYQDLIIFSGVRKGTFGVRVKQENDLWSTETVWHNTDLPMYMSSPVIIGAQLFGFSNKKKGQLFCLNPTTGAMTWQSEGRGGSNAALVAAGNNLLVLNAEGELLIVDARDKSFEPIKSYTVANSPTWSYPVVLEKQILIKDESHLTLWGE